MRGSGGSVSVPLIAALAPVGAGLGLAVPTLINLVLRTVPAAAAGAASGTLVTAQQLGNALGVATMGTIFFAELGARTGPSAFGDAFSVTLAAQALLALVAAAIVSRAREPAPAASPAGGTPSRPIIRAVGRGGSGRGPRPPRRGTSRASRPTR